LHTLLTILGLAVLILTYVSVESLVSTIEVNSAGSISTFAGEVDVWSKGASSPLVSRLPESYSGIIGNISGVTIAAPIDLALLTIQNDQAVVAGAIPSELPFLLNYSIISGRMITSNQSGILAMGTALSERLGSATGQNVQLNGMAYQVSGVYKTNTWLDYSVIIPHSVAQQMIGMEGGTSMIAVLTRDVGSVDNIIGQIRTLLPTVDAFRSGDSPSKVSPIFSSVENVATVMVTIVTLAAVVGIMNSNFNNLRERMRAFAIFKATGASYGQIIKLVLYESLFLGSLGTLLGLAISYVTLSLITIPIAQNLSVRINLVPFTLVYAALLGVSVSFLAALYPAIRTARVRPQEVFRFG
jgi:putative ABC transport system permease protein